MWLNALKLAIVKTRKQEQATYCTDEREQHVGLSVPRVSLRAQELIGALPERNGCSPFDEFICCTDCEDHADDDECEHLSSAHKPPSDKDLASDKSGDEALEEVTNLVVRIAGEVEDIGKVKAKRNSCVCERASGHEHKGMKEDANVEQVCQWETAIRCPKDGQRDEHREYFQHPGGTVVRSNAGQYEERHQSDGSGKKDLRALYWHTRAT